MNFAIVVHGAPFSSQASATALRFACSAVAKGHTVHRVFFYHDGIQTANRLAVIPTDEAGTRDGWVALAQASGIELSVCIASSLKRGVIDEAARDRYHLPGANLHPAFAIAGLGQLVESAIVTDRLITFAA